MEIIQKECKLCRNNIANKRNSHIVPKFMCKSLFISTNPRHSIAIFPSGKSRKIQDAPKEDYILCSHCEKRFEVIETYFARIISDTHEYKALPEKFEHFVEPLERIECKVVTPILFRLFIYSIVWRASISELYEFEKFKLKSAIEEELRVFLNTFLAINKADLLKNSEKVESLPTLLAFLSKPKVRKVPSGGSLTCYSYEKDMHLLMLVDFQLILLTEDKTQEFIESCSKESMKATIYLLEETEWKDFNRMLVHKMLEEGAKLIFNKP